MNRFNVLDKTEVNRVEALRDQVVKFFENILQWLEVFLNTSMLMTITVIYYSCVWR